MKKSIVLFLAVMMVSFMTAQEFTGTATFSTASAMKVMLGSPAQNDSTNANKKTIVNVSQQEELNKKIKKAMQKEFKLVFSNKESVYKEIPKLKNVSEEKGLEVIGLGGGAEGGLYKNTGNRDYVENRDVFGKLFLVKDKLKEWNWELKKETKQIGGYLCHKAEATEQVVSVRKVMKDGQEQEVEKVTYKTVTAWYTPEIPINQGPGEYWGLPGFILEVNDGRLNMVCTEITVNPDQMIELKIPKKGKKANRAKFEKIYDQKVQEMVKMYENKRKKS